MVAHTPLLKSNEKNIKQLVGIFILTQGQVLQISLKYLTYLLLKITLSYYPQLLNYTQVTYLKIRQKLLLNLLWITDCIWQIKVFSKVMF
jgi:hypothetical protein